MIGYDDSGGGSNCWSESEIESFETKSASEVLNFSVSKLDGDCRFRVNLSARVPPSGRVSSDTWVGVYKSGQDKVYED